MAGAVPKRFQLRRVTVRVALYGSQEFSDGLNAETLDIDPKFTEIKLADYESLVGGQAARRFLIDDVGVTIKFSNMTREMLIGKMSGRAFDLAERPVHDAVSGVKHGVFYRMSRIPKKGAPVVVSSSATPSPTTAPWASSHAYAVGALVVPSAANGHYYRCTVAGVSDVAEPTWPTGGGTVVDGGTSWVDAGALPIVYVRGTDYWTDGAVIAPLSTGSIPAGAAAELHMHYTSAEQVSYQANLAIGQHYTIMFSGTDVESGNRVSGIIYKVPMSGSKDMIIQKEFATVEVPTSALRDDSVEPGAAELADGITEMSQYYAINEEV